MSKTKVRVAFATSDLKLVDQHFGSAERFAIYELDADGQSLKEVVEFGDLSQDGNENKLVEKFVVLDGCVAVYSIAVGPSAVRQLMSLGIQPIKVVAGETIAHYIQTLQQELQEGPSGWLARALKQQDEKDPERFAEMESEGWDE